MHHGIVQFNQGHIDGDAPGFSALGWDLSLRQKGIGAEIAKPMPG